MKTSVFEFHQYRLYLISLTKNPNVGGRGSKTVLAQSAGVQLAYLTRVLQGNADLSLEQALNLSKNLGHTDEERKYFLLLVQKDRAGSTELKDYFDRQIKEFEQRRLNLKERFQVKSSLSHSDQATYYSHWLYVAFHVLVSIPAYQTREALAQRLRLPLETIGQVADFLISTGLVVLEGDKFKVGVTRVHLGTDSPWISKHHINWRLQAMHSFDNFRDSKSDHLHYTSVVSISKNDAALLQKKFIQMAEEFNEIVKDSKEEQMRCFCLDFFKV